MYVGWQQGILGGMKSEMMAHVYDIGGEVLSDATGELYGILYGLMCGMGFVTQAVYHQQFYPFQQFAAPGCDIRHICDVA